jgi:hypothetical protein
MFSSFAFVYDAPPAGGRSCPVRICATTLAGPPVAARLIGVLTFLALVSIRLGEPALAALVVNQRTGLPGDGFVGNPAIGKEDCFGYWKKQS